MLLWVTGANRVTQRGGGYPWEPSGAAPSCIRTLATAINAGREQYASSKCRSAWATIFVQKSPDGATSRIGTAHLTGSEWSDVVPGIPTYDNTCEGGRVVKAPHAQPWSLPGMRSAGMGPFITCQRSSLIQDSQAVSSSGTTESGNSPSHGGTPAEGPCPCSLGRRSWSPSCPSPSSAQPRRSPSTPSSASTTSMRTPGPEGAPTGCPAAPPPTQYPSGTQARRRSRLDKPPRC